MVGRFLIYGLVDPRTGHLRYVGKSTSGLKRPRMHTQPWALAHAGGSHRGCWFRSLVAEHLQPEVTILQEVTGSEDLYDLERRWISYLRGLGCPLTNTTDGGAGCQGVSPSAETRAKITAANTGKVHSAETRAKMSAARQRRVITAETRAKASASLKGRVVTPEHAAKISAKLVGHPVSEETRAKISAAHRGRHA